MNSKQALTLITLIALLSYSCYKLGQGNAVIIENDDDTFKIFINVNTIGKGSVFNPDITYTSPEDLSNDDLGKLKMKIEAPGTSESDNKCSALNNYENQDLRRGCGVQKTYPPKRIFR